MIEKLCLVECTEKVSCIMTANDTICIERARVKHTEDLSACVLQIT
jgi:hypothetical protein